MGKRVDLNSDLGEGFGNYRFENDEEIIKHISSVNIACGFHAGDPRTMRNTVQLARKHNVAIGAHPGLPDLLGFGRRKMDITPEEARDYVVYQVGALKAFVESDKKTKLQHIKCHGAFASMAGKEDIARAIIDGMAEIDPNLILVTRTGSMLYKLGKNSGIRVAGEFLADLHYDRNGVFIVEQEKSEADPQEVAEKVLKMIEFGKITTVTGEDIDFKAETICIHGDTPNAIQVLRKITEELAKNNIEIKAVGESDEMPPGHNRISAGHWRYDDN